MQDLGRLPLFGGGDLKYRSSTAYPRAQKKLCGSLESPTPVRKAKASRNALGEQWPLNGQVEAALTRSRSQGTLLEELTEEGEAAVSGARENAKKTATKSRESSKTSLPKTLRQTASDAQIVVYGPSTFQEHAASRRAKKSSRRKNSRVSLLVSRFTDRSDSQSSSTYAPKPPKEQAASHAWQPESKTDAQAATNPPETTYQVTWPAELEGTQQELSVSRAPDDEARRKARLLELEVAMLRCRNENLQRRLTNTQNELEVLQQNEEQMLFVISEHEETIEEQKEVLVAFWAQHRKEILRQQKEGMKTFFDLPAELRNAIYEMVADNDVNILGPNTGTLTKSARFAQINRQIRNEYLPVYHTRIHDYHDLWVGSWGKKSALVDSTRREKSLRWLDTFWDSRSQWLGRFIFTGFRISCRIDLEAEQQPESKMSIIGLVESPGIRTFVGRWQAADKTVDRQQEVDFHGACRTVFEWGSSMRSDGSRAVSLEAMKELVDLVCLGDANRFSEVWSYEAGGTDSSA